MDAMTSVPAPAAEHLAADSPSRPLDQPQGQRLLTLLVYAMAFLSGAAALVYEVVWSKMLALTFGGSTLAASAVIAGFMGGMGIGAWLYHKVAARTRQPLQFYGYLELGIGFSAAAITLVMYRLPTWLVWLIDIVPAGAPLAIARFAVVFLLLVPPAVCMGATFPALCAVLIRSSRTLDRHLGAIYGINTLGAASGAVLAGLYSIERFGLTRSVTIANGLNLSIAVASFLLAMRWAGSQSASAEDDAQPLRTELPKQVTGAVLLGSGFTTLGYEIMWFRGLRYLVGNSTYALTIVLVVFLIGLGCGSLALGWLLRRFRPERLLAWSQWATMLLALETVAAAQFAMSLPVERQWFSIFSSGYRLHSWEWRLAVDAAMAGAVMLPAALVMGLSFPLASRLFLGDLRSLGRGVGTAYLLANLGSILGSLTAAIWLLPAWGTIGGTRVLAAVNWLLGSGIFLATRQRASVSSAVAAAGVTGVFLWGLAVWQLPSRLTLQGESGVYDRAQVIFADEGDLATVHVLDDPIRPGARAMTIDGCLIGCTQEFLDWLYLKQALLAHLPMLLDSRLEETLNIGLGSASTLSILATYPQVKRLDCVEINAGVVEGAKEYFPEGAVFDDPRVHVEVEDALHYLLRSQRQYDAIISDGKQNPDYPGSSTMLCHDFYRYACDRLSPRGLFVQWLPTGTLHAEFITAMRNCCDVFPYVSVFYFPESDIIVVGSREPLTDRPRLTEEEFQKLSSHPALAAFPLPRAESFLAHFVCDKQQLMAVLPPGPLSTWDHNFLEFADFKAPFAIKQIAHFHNINLLVSTSHHPMSDGIGVVSELDQSLFTATQYVRLAYHAMGIKQMTGAVKLAAQAMEADPGNPEAKRTFEEFSKLTETFRAHFERQQP
jgi:spermidine synthase